MGILSNIILSIALFSFLVPIVYALYLFNNVGEDNNSLLFYIFHTRFIKLDSFNN